MLSQSSSLDLDRGWSIGEETFSRIVAEMQRDGATSVVEFGSGISSIRLAMALPDARIISIESDAEFLQELEQKARHHRVDGALKPELRRLKWQRHGGAFFLSYAPGPFPSQVDAVLIDGPPRWTRRGREACLYQVASHLRMKGKVFLDDFDRPGEKKIVSNWMQAYPVSFRIGAIETGHGVCVLEKVAPTEGPRSSPSSLADHFVQSALLVLSHPFRR